jgi:hypothetical protein
MTYTAADCKHCSRLATGERRVTFADKTVSTLVGGVAAAIAP